jgi:hypothetical protein
MRMNGDQDERAGNLVAKRHVQLRPLVLARYARRSVAIRKHSMKFLDKFLW